MYKLKIKEYRLENNMTQKELAEGTGVSQNYLSELENNKYDIKLSVLCKIARELNVCPKCLIACSKHCKKCKRKKL